ncbi:AAA family ATPase [Alteromonas oceani]|uniref:AAA family ATPase n=1 Tax=Alteromonas oceani TaxID=2071609 RepID=A0ABV7JSW6_9ALTE|nr:AAA family ATPase [Alteromonas oceani]
MDLEQRYIVCCNYKAHANDEKGQAIALYERDKETLELHKINEDKYFCEPDDCEVHIIPNGTNDHDYRYLNEKYKDRLYLIQCIENKAVDPNSSLSRNKSNLFKIESVEPRMVCEILEVNLPDEANPEVVLETIPLTRHVFIKERDSIFGPFEFDLVNDSDSNKIYLKKPSDTKYLGKTIPKLAIIEFKYQDLEENIDVFNYSNKYIDGKPFAHTFIRNLQSLKDKPYNYYNYGFMDELAKAVGTIVKETNTKGITSSQITMLSARIKNKKNSFMFDTDYVFKQLNDSVKFEKVITQGKEEIRKIILEQALNDNDKLKEHFVKILKEDETLVSEVKESIRAEETQESSKLNDLKHELLEYNAKIQQAKQKISEVDKDKENSIIQKLKQEQRNLYSEIEELEIKRENITSKYSSLFEFDNLDSELEKLKEDLKKQNYLYDDQVQKVSDKKAEIEKYQKELQELTNRSAEEYRKELLSVKNSIDVLTHIDNEKTSFEFQCLGQSDLISIKNNNDLVEYIKYIQAALSNFERSLSVEHIINYLVCIDSSFITILSGLPGTGKTSLVNILNEKVLNTRFNSVQVGRGWSSERDLLGYFNPITNSYISSSSGLYEFLDELDSDERLNVVLLDEANLSPIEHYWSKFMGLTDDYNEREFALTNNKSLRITNKLRFIATINNDMTTEPLSPRLLDRAPCIRLDTFNRLDNGNKSGLDLIEDDRSILDELNSKFKNNSFYYSDFKLAVDGCESDNEIISNMLEILEQIQNILTTDGIDGESLGPRIHLSERRNRLIRLFLTKSLGIYNQFCLNAMDWIEVKKDYYFLDFAISQFVLPLITGHGKSFRKRLEHLKDNLNNVQQIHNCEMPISIDLLSRMITQGEEDLDTYDFMSLR